MAILSGLLTKNNIPTLNDGDKWKHKNYYDQFLIFFLESIQSLNAIFYLLLFAVTQK